MARYDSLLLPDRDSDQLPCGGSETGTRTLSASIEAMDFDRRSRSHERKVWGREKKNTTSWSAVGTGDGLGMNLGGEGKS